MNQSNLQGSQARLMMIWVVMMASVFFFAFLSFDLEAFGLQVSQEFNQMFIYVFIMVGVMNLFIAQFIPQKLIQEGRKSNRQHSLTLEQEYSMIHVPLVIKYALYEFIGSLGLVMSIMGGDLRIAFAFFVIALLLIGFNYPSVAVKNKLLK